MAEQPVLPQVGGNGLAQPEASRNFRVIGGERLPFKPQRLRIRHRVPPALVAPCLNHVDKEYTATYIGCQEESECAMKKVYKPLMALALLMATALAHADDDFDGIRKPRWNWKSATAIYAGTIAADYAMTQRCLEAGTCVEGNERAQTSGDRLKLSGAAFGAMMLGDFLSFRLVHRKAPIFLRAGFVVHRGLAQMRVNVTW